MTRDHHHAGKTLIDRRSFVTSGPVRCRLRLGWSILGCAADYEIVLPCLGPALPPVPIAGMTYIWASQIGCALDCDLSNGRNKNTGGPATDDGPQSLPPWPARPPPIPSRSSSMEPRSFRDCTFPLAAIGVLRASVGTGFFVKSGINNDGIHNGGPDGLVPSDPGPPAPSRGSNVSLSNFTLNGNQGNGSTGVSTSGKRQGSARTWYYGINLVNLNNIKIENVVVVNTAAYHVRLSNVGNVVVSGCVMRSHGLSTDGLHFNGPANDITISKCDFTTGDDAIALNCPEGYSGNISRVTVTDCTFKSLALMRLYTTDGDHSFRIDQVTVSNCSGTFSEAAFLIGLIKGSLPDSVASLSVSDCDLTAPSFLEWQKILGPSRSRMSRSFPHNKMSSGSVIKRTTSAASCEPPRSMPT